MTPTSIIVIGAGGHAAVLADALLAAGAPVIGFTDIDPLKRAHRICGLPVLGDDDALEDHRDARLVNGLGTIGDERSASLRRTVEERLSARGWIFTGVRHPSAVVSAFAHVHETLQLLAACVIQATATIGPHGIVNTGAIVEHGAEVAERVHIAPRAVVCADVRIGARCHVGAGAVVRQGVFIGNDTVISAGAVVVKDFAGGGRLVGVPARPAA